MARNAAHFDETHNYLAYYFASMDSTKTPPGCILILFSMHLATPLGGSYET
jgi:hypothetical protein